MNRRAALAISALFYAACADSPSSLADTQDIGSAGIDAASDATGDTPADDGARDAGDAEARDATDADARDATDASTDTPADAPPVSDTTDSQDSAPPDAGETGAADVSDAGTVDVGDTGEPGRGFPSIEAFRTLDADNAALAGELDRADRFGRSMAVLGDLSGDGTLEIAVGTRSDDDGATDAGAVWIVSLTSAGDVVGAVKLSATRGGVGDDILRADLAPLYFGYGTAGLGDVNGDGVPDLGVTAPLDVDGGSYYTLLLNRDGTVASKVRTPSVPGDAIGRLGDIDGDGREEYGLASTSEGGTGAVRIYSLAADHTLVLRTTWSPRDVAALARVQAGDAFGGRSVARIGDLDGDGIDEVGVGAFESDDGRGALWVLFLDATGAVRDATRISDGEGGLTTHLNVDDNFGHALTAIGDVDGDGVPDVLTGANRFDGDAGSLYVLLMQRDGTVRDWERWDAAALPALNVVAGERFGRSMTTLGDLTGDGGTWVAVGGGARTTGNVRLLQLR